MRTCWRSQAPRWRSGPRPASNLDDIVEAHLGIDGNAGNVGVYQRVFGAAAEAGCRNDDRDGVRSVFAWAFDVATASAFGPPITMGELVAQAQASVRYIRTPGGCGSAFVVTADGYVVTNNHVLDGARRVVVGTHEGFEEQAAVVAADADADLALLKLPGGGPYPFIGFGRSAGVGLGEGLVILGYPLCLETLTVTRGVLSARYDGWLQTDATANPGSSGGPGFDLRGGVIGIATTKLGGGAVAGVENANFLIDGDTARQRLDDWITRHRAGTLAPPPPPPTPTPTPEPLPHPSFFIESVGIARDSDCTSGGDKGVRWLGSLPGDPLPEYFCVVYVVKWAGWPTGWTHQTVWTWPSGQEERDSPRVWCEYEGDRCRARYMKVGWNNPNRFSRSSGNLAVALYVNGEYIRTDYFRVS